jgi:hypothetical protein
VFEEAVGFIWKFKDKMPDSLEENRRRLFLLDAKLRLEADRMLEKSGVGSIIRAEGFKPVGSYIMKTMTWRDLDFERTDDRPDWQQHWELGLKLAYTGWAWRLRCLDAYREPGGTDKGLYWGIWVNDPAGGDIWKIDLWTARPEEFERAAPRRPLWESKLNEDSRYCILAIKEAVCNLPEYRQSLLSVHIYEAVLENDIRSIDEFWDWWKKNYGK